MRYPALNDLIKLADNKYSLVLATAKRAREIVDGDEPLVKITVDNPVTIATNEISEEMIHCIHKKRISEGVKSHEDDYHESDMILFDTDENENSSTMKE